MIFLHRNSITAFGEGAKVGKPFVSLISNDQFQIACTGQTVYVLDIKGNELAKFKDMTYAYYPALHPKGDLAAVYSNTGVMAVYSLSELRLIRKFRVTAVKDTQTDRIPCFSPDGQYLYHIEGRKGNSLNSRLSVYSTTDFRPVFRLFEQGQETVFLRMEFDRETGILFLLGYERQENSNNYFVAKLNGQSLEDVRSLNKHTYDFYESAVYLKQTGFTQDSYQWSEFAIKPRVRSDIERMVGHPVDMGPFNRSYTLDDLMQMKLSLSCLWAEAENH